MWPPVSSRSEAGSENPERAIRPLVEIKFGSHLYGTATATSDLDIRGLYIPVARDILLQRVAPVVSHQRPKVRGEKNKPDDVDYELYSPARFLSLLAGGQTMALDMLFAPAGAMLGTPHPLWQAIKTVAPRLLTRNAGSFLGYCRQQAHRHSAKGARMAAVRKALDFMKNAEAVHGPSARLAQAADGLQALAAGDRFLALGETPDLHGVPVPWFEVCGKKALLSANIKSGRILVQNMLDEYGERARAAECNEGVDWKALSHAVRIGNEAVEFFSTGHIIFPRPEARHLLSIRQGLVPFQQVSEEIEELFAAVESASAASELPDTFDQAIMDDFIARLHHDIILQETL